MRSHGGPWERVTHCLRILPKLAILNAQSISQFRVAYHKEESARRQCRSSCNRRIWSSIHV